MISIAPICGLHGDHSFREFFQHRFVSQHLGRAKLWQGRGAEILGLKNPVTLNTFQNLLQGRSPDGVKQFRDPSVHGNKELAWRLTITAPPSLSVLWALASRQTRARLEHAHFSAARHALFHFQGAVSGWDRAAWETVEGRDRAPGTVFATFMTGAGPHRNPRLQTNAFVFNMAVGRDAQVGTLNGEKVHNQTAALQKNYDNMLDAMNCGTSDLAMVDLGISPKLVRQFSSAPLFESSKRADQGAIVKLLRGSDLFAEWQRQGKEWGWDPANHLGFHGQRNREFADIAEKLRSELQRGRDFVRRSRESLPELFQARRPEPEQSQARTKETKDDGHSHSH